MTEDNRIPEIRELIREHDLHGASADSLQTVTLIRALVDRATSERAIPEPTEGQNP